MHPDGSHRPSSRVSGSRAFAWARHALCFMFLLAAGQARAGASIIFDNGSPDYNDGHGSDFDAFYFLGRQSFAQVAEDFSLPTGSGPITGVTWWGDYASSVGPPPSPPVGAPPTDDFTIRFFDDVNGVAATTPFLSLDVGQVDRTVTGSQIAGLPAYEYSATIAPLSLTPDTTYWLSIVDNTTADQTQNFFWATSNWIDGDGLIRGADGTSWRSIYTGWNGAEEAFQLTGGASPTPEPASLTLFGMGLLAFGFRRRQKS